MRSARNFLGAVVAVVIVGATPARAQNAGNDGLERAHYVTGQSYYHQARFREALQEFSEAWGISHRPGFTFNIALCNERLANLSDAIDSYERYLKEEPPDAPDRAEVRAHMQALREQLAATGTATPLPDSVAAPALTEGPVRRKPIYRRWQLWLGVGLAVSVGVAVGVAVGALAHGSNGTVAGDYVIRY